MYNRPVIRTRVFIELQSDIQIITPKIIAYILFIIAIAYDKSIKNLQKFTY